MAREQPDPIQPNLVGLLKTCSKNVECAPEMVHWKRDQKNSVYHIAIMAVANVTVKMLEHL